MKSDSFFDINDGENRIKIRETIPNLVIDKTKTIPDGLLKLIRHNLRIRNHLETDDIIPLLKESLKSRDKKELDRMFK